MDGGLDMVEGSMFELLRLVNPKSTQGGATESWMTAIGSMRRTVRRNVRHHYDLSAELYALFLDEDGQYSCACVETDDASLDEAQLAKKRHIAAKLLFDRPDLATLDIGCGCGWGGLGLYLAKHCDAEVKGVTLSSEQRRIAVERAAAFGRAARARFELEDYRATQGPFDRIVSVGMFEHVGLDFCDAYFRRCARLLDRDGVMRLHTIGRFDVPQNTHSFIARYIFPGGYIPALSQVMPAVERAGMIVTDVEVLRLHYAETLRHRRMRSAARREEARAI